MKPVLKAHGRYKLAEDRITAQLFHATETEYTTKIVSPNVEDKTMAHRVEVFSIHSSPKEREMLRTNFPFKQNDVQCYLWMEKDTPNVQVEFQQGRTIRDHIANTG